VDRTGSKPVLAGCLALFVIVLAGWWALAAGFVQRVELLVAALSFATGVAGANFGIANARLTMATVPLMGRNHFFALFTVIANVILGLSPIVWGIVLDLIGPKQLHIAGLVWDRYGLYFAAVTIIAVAATAYVAMLHEPGTEPQTLDAPAPNKAMSQVAPAAP
jgi:MFS family permease